MYVLKPLQTVRLMHWLMDQLPLDTGAAVTVISNEVLNDAENGHTVTEMDKDLVRVQGVPLVVTGEIMVGIEIGESMYEVKAVATEAWFIDRCNPGKGLATSTVS